MNNYGGLKVVRSTPRYFTCKCPFHNDSHASAMVYTDTMFFICFVCNIRKPLEQVLKDIDAEDFDVHREIPFEPDLVTETVRFIPPTPRAIAYMQSRGVDTDRLPDYITSVPEDTGVGFKFVDGRGKAIGAQLRIYPEHQGSFSRFVLVGERTPVFGPLREFLLGKYERVVLFEKAFGCLKAQQACDAHGLSVACVSSAGSAVQHGIAELFPFGTVAFYDNDKAGRRAGEKLKTLGFDVFISHIPVDEMPSDELAHTVQEALQWNHSCTVGT